MYSEKVKDLVATAEAIEQDRRDAEAIAYKYNLQSANERHREEISRLHLQVESLEEQVKMLTPYFNYYELALRLVSKP